MTHPHHYPPWSSAGMSKCAKSHQELLNMHNTCKPGRAWILCSLKLDLEGATALLREWWGHVPHLRLLRPQVPTSRKTGDMASPGSWGWCCHTSPRVSTPGKTKVLGSSPNLMGIWVGVWGDVPLRQQVDVTLSLQAGQPGVNVPNHVNSPWDKYPRGSPMNALADLNETHRGHAWG